MSKRVSYENLPLAPMIIADQVCREVYVSQEFSAEHRDSRLVEIVEGRRKKMSEAAIRIFAENCEARCRAAYAAKAGWFEKIVKSQGERGRDQLYVWVRHWLASYLNDPAAC